jgi:hypothetical protein
MIALMALLMTGCAAFDKAISVGEKVNDEALTAAEFTICYGASVGSIRRHYGDELKAKVWASLCNSTDSFSPDKDK